MILQSSQRSDPTNEVHESVAAPTNRSIFPVDLLETVMHPRHRGRSDMSGNKELQSVQKCQEKSPTEENQSYDESNEGEEEKEEREFEERRDEEASRNSRKLCKTLDLNVETTDNLYVAVRQNLQKVNRISKSSLPPVKKRSASEGERSPVCGVSQESSIGRFSMIKAFFDHDKGKKARSLAMNCRSTIISKLKRSLEANTQTSSYEELESKRNELDMNDNVVSK